MNRNEFKTKIFSLFIEFLVAENRPSQKKILKAETKQQKIGKTNHKLRSQNGAYGWFCRFFAVLFRPSIFFFGLVCFQRLEIL